VNPNPRIEQAAQRHTDDMAFGNYFEHVGSRGDTLLGRLRAAGYINGQQGGFEIGENIGWATLWLATPHAMVNAWMNSPDHRANILDARFSDTGIGVSPHPPSSLARGQGGAIYTQDFGVISGG
jgi:predicted outer membrane repeat protein